MLLRVCGRGGDCCGLKGGQAKMEGKAQLGEEIGRENVIGCIRGADVKDKSCN